MKRVLLLLLLSTAIAAQLDVEVRDFQTNDLLTNMNVAFEFQNTDTNQTLEKIATLSSTGIATLDIPNGPWAVKAKLDDTTTDGKDYYAEQNINLQQTLKITLFLQPVGTIRGTVTDENGNTVRGAAVQYTCSGDYGEKFIAETDDFGAFSTDWLPVGSCKVLARYEAITGSQTVHIQRGEIAEANVQLTERILNPLSEHPLRYIAFGVLVALIAGGAFVYYFVKKKKQEKTEPKVKEDIIKTLNDREKAVVQHLLEREGKSNLAELYRSTHIPKTSLVRCLQGLEKKTIIEMEKYGKARKVRLTGWFMMKT